MSHLTLLFIWTRCISPCHLTHSINVHNFEAFISSQDCLKGLLAWSKWRDVKSHSGVREKHSRGARLGRILNFAVLNGTIWCTLYFYATAGPLNVAGTGESFPLFPLSTGPTKWKPGQKATGQKATGTKSHRTKGHLDIIIIFIRQLIKTLNVLISISILF